MTERALALPLALFVLATLGGCANPADDVPDAKVGAAAQTQPASAAATKGVPFVLTETSKVGFIGSKVTGSHQGGVQEVAGEIRLVDGRAEGSSVRVVMNMTSLWADNQRLTGHLKSPDFFDVLEFPTATFTSTTVAPAEQGYLVSGDLEMHGIRKPITFPARITVDQERIHVSAGFSINRFDFGIVYPGKPDDLIRKEVVVRLELEAVPGTADLAAFAAQAEAAAAHAAKQEG